MKTEHNQTLIPSETRYNSRAVRLCEQLLEDIQAGKYPPGGYLPAELSLAARYKVSRSTVRRAVGILAERKHLVKLPQRGVRVSAVDKTGLARFSSRPVSKITLAAAWAMWPDYRSIQMQEGIRRYAGENDLDFRIFLSPEGHEQTLEILNHAEKYGIQGLIVAPFRNERYFIALNRLVTMGFPVVTVRAIDTLPAINSVETDNYGSSYRATTYLIEKYRRPVYYITTPEGFCGTLERRVGFRRAMLEAGYDAGLVEQHTVVEEVPLEDPAYWSEGKAWLPGYVTGVKLLKQIELPASILCVNDYTAQGVYRAAEEQGLSVGKDVAVVGIDDIPLAQRLKPGLTTINSPKEEVGYEAARLLHGLIRNPGRPVAHVRLPVELVIRDSA